MNIYQRSVCRRSVRFKSGFVRFRDEQVRFAQHTGIAIKRQCLCLQDMQQTRWEKRKMTSLLMWIIRCRREQLSNSHPPLHAQQPSHSISQMCVVCGHGRWLSLWPSLWAVVDALRFGAYRALRALCSHENSDDHAENVRSSSL